MTESSENTISRSRDLHQHTGQGGRRRIDGAVLIALEAVMDFKGALDQQEKTASDQDQVAAGKRMAPDGKQGLAQAHDPRDGDQEYDPHDHGKCQPDQSGALSLLFRQAANQNGDENDIVDAQYDF